MKKHLLSILSISFLSLLCTVLSSFSHKRGGDVFEIYLNGKQMHQQFVHIDKGAKTLSFASLGENDKIGVLYSHCGQSGTKRMITLRNEKNELIKQLSFPDATSSRSIMSFSRKDVAKLTGNRVSLYYSSREMPEAKLLANISWNAGKSVAKL